MPCRLLAVLAFLLLPLALGAGPNEGYYRFPAVHGSTLVFTSEGDLWKVGLEGGQAQRLTTHLGQESHPHISPDGKRVAFVGTYDGPSEVYVMPLEGGLPKRLTYDGETSRVSVAGWSPDGRVLYSTRHFATLPGNQLVLVDPKSCRQERVPLAQASDGVFDPTGKTLFFTRQAFQGSITKRYKGGWAQNLWKFTAGSPEAVPLTTDYAGTSKAPMWHGGRVYFATDRDGNMNVWSMTEDGKDLKQHTFHRDFDVQSPTLSGDRIVYQLGADLHLLELPTGKDRLVPITLASDFDQTRERWVKRPMDYLTSAHLSPDGDRVVLTARGQVFVAPAGNGRLIEAGHKKGVRYRNARFFPDGKSLLALSDETGELEFWRLPAGGTGAATALTNEGKVFRFGAVLAPDGKRFAYHDKDQQLWVHDLEKKASVRVAVADNGFMEAPEFSWSPDSHWLAFVLAAPNHSRQIHLHNTRDGKTTALTSDRVDSFSPAWSPDGKWLYFLSDRNLVSTVGSPWGPRQPEPFFDNTTKIYQVALRKGLHSPFQPADEATEASGPGTLPAGSGPDLDGITRRVRQVPAPPGNYDNLEVNGQRLFWLGHEHATRDGVVQRTTKLRALPINNRKPSVVTVFNEVKGYELSGDGRKLLVHRGDDLYVFDSGRDSVFLAETRVDLGRWTFAVEPREEWRQMLVDAWRMERDYFYDRKLHGVAARKVLERHLPLVERVRDRDELNNLMEQMVGEFEALHVFVTGGDQRKGLDQIEYASLGAELARDEKAGGYRVEHIYQGDPDYPEELAPLARADAEVEEGDVIEAINGVETLAVPHPGLLLRNQAGRPVLLQIKPKKGGKSRRLVTTPVSPSQASNLRYAEWELTRRQAVEEQGAGQIGYVHLRAMGSGNITEWARNFYPVFNRQGLIIDVRNNQGGNIDSWVLEKLLRKAWFFWQPRVGKPLWNMQYAFRGHVVVLCNEATASDGEAFTEGFRRLGLGKVIGTRTWGGEIWLSFNTHLADGGIASVPQVGVFGPERSWLIEGHGVDPDVVVDNLPHATYQGKDAQLERAIRHLKEEIRKHPVPVPATPPYPDKGRVEGPDRRKG
jgi:tricorn protease